MRSAAVCALPVGGRPRPRLVWVDFDMMFIVTRYDKTINRADLALRLRGEILDLPGVLAVQAFICAVR
jgi:hypothetical protein